MKNLSNVDFDLNVENINIANRSWTGWGTYYASDGTYYELGTGEHSFEEEVTLEDGTIEECSCSELICSYLNNEV